MSTLSAVDPTQQPPPFQDNANMSHSGHGSVGPVIGVLAVIMVLGAVAVVIGRLCSGRRVMGHLQYDFEGWMETKCSTCIDGRLDPPPPVPVVVVESGRSNGLENETVEPQDAPGDIGEPQGESASKHEQPEEQCCMHEN